jgi:FkbM family methyltransferase
MKKRFLALTEALFRPAFRTKRWSWPLTQNCIRHPIYLRILDFYNLYLARFYKTEQLVRIEPDDAKPFSMYCYGNQGSIEISLVVGHVYEPHITYHLLKELAQADVFIDVGANIGYYSLLAAAQRPTLRVLSFEPVTAAQERLQKNIAVNGFANIAVHPIALGREQEHKNIYIRKELGHNSFLESGASQNTGVEEQITIQPFDAVELLQNKNVCVKIDVEGFEYEVLQGMRKTFTNNRCAVVFEFTPRLFRHISKDPEQYAIECLKYLHDLHFALYKIVFDKRVPIEDPEAFVRANLREQMYILALPQ